MPPRKSQSDQLAEMMQQMIAMQSKPKEETIDKKPFSTDLKMIVSAATAIVVIAYSATTQFNTINTRLAAVEAVQAKQEKTNAEILAQIESTKSMVTALQNDVKDLTKITSRLR